MSGRLSFSKSSSQHWSTFFVSNDFSMHRIQVLSIPAKAFACSGICLAISPPVNTGYRLLQSVCTLIQRSNISEVSENLLISSSTCFLKGSTWRWALMEDNTIWSSSSRSVISCTQRPLSTILSLFPHGPNSNSFTLQNSLISPRAFSIFFCFSADSPISSMSSASYRTLAFTRSSMIKISSWSKGILCWVFSLRAYQWRSLTASFLRIVIIGNKALRFSIELFSYL